MPWISAMQKPVDAATNAATQTALVCWSVGTVTTSSIDQLVAVMLPIIWSPSAQLATMTNTETGYGSKGPPM
jgi:hypothetical protein